MAKLDTALETGDYTWVMVQNPKRNAVKWF